MGCSQGPGVVRRGDPMACLLCQHGVLLVTHQCLDGGRGAKLNDAQRKRYFFFNMETEGWETVLGYDNMLTYRNLPRSSYTCTQCSQDRCPIKILIEALAYG